MHCGPRLLTLLFPFLFRCHCALSTCLIVGNFILQSVECSEWCRVVMLPDFQLPSPFLFQSLPAVCLSNPQDHSIPIPPFTVSLSTSPQFQPTNLCACVYLLFPSHPSKSLPFHSIHHSFHSNQTSSLLYIHFISVIESYPLLCSGRFPTNSHITSLFLTFAYFPFHLLDRHNRGPSRVIWLSS